MRLAIIDLSGLCHASWHASANESVNHMATHVLGTVRAHLTSSTFDRVAVCCDAPGKKWRHDISPDYKANRPPADKMMLEQIRQVAETLDADGCHVFKKNGQEADDLISSLVEWAHNDGTFFSVVLISDDKDFAQLVCDPDGEQGMSVAIFRPCEQKHYGRAEVIERWGVPPEKFADFLSLCGDTADNIPGVFKVGPKKACALLAKYGDLSGLTDAVNTSATDFTPALYENLLASRDENGRVAGKSETLVALSIDALTKEECETVLQKKDPKDMTTNDEAWSDTEELCEHGAAVGEQCDQCNPPAKESAPAIAAELVEEESPAPPAPTAPPQALVVRDVPFKLQLEPTTGEEAWHLTKHIMNSRLFSDYGTREELWVIIGTGRELGQGWASSLRGIKMVKGKAEMSSAFMLNLILSSGKAEYFSCVNTTAEKAEFITHRKGDPKPVPMSYTIDEARQAKLTGNNWVDRPKTMLRWRCIAELARMVYSDVLHGCYVEGELDD